MRPQEIDHIRSYSEIHHKGSFLTGKLIDSSRNISNLSNVSISQCLHKRTCKSSASENGKLTHSRPSQRGFGLRRGTSLPERTFWTKSRLQESTNGLWDTVLAILTRKMSYRPLQFSGDPLTTTPPAALGPRETTFITP
ncbi:uncharacterized protein LOC119766518 [Culex quinquefasciatus]|uniref:uncharacterized protein LOC119766518 n=1 Tax=Culex quinquefasciatus TaxID=7176 RepID=UPI0018E2C285|nr:uncharacterized protein LOC119766518 [Culex quinquefasciatus]